MAFATVVITSVLLKQGYNDKRKKLTYSVCESVFQSILCFSHVPYLRKEISKSPAAAERHKPVLRAEHFHLH